MNTVTCIYLFSRFLQRILEKLLFCFSGSAITEHASRLNRRNERGKESEGKRVRWDTKPKIGREKSIRVTSKPDVQYSPHPYSLRPLLSYPTPSLPLPLVSPSSTPSIFHFPILITVYRILSLPFPTQPLPPLIIFMFIISHNT